MDYYTEDEYFDKKPGRRVKKGRVFFWLAVIVFITGIAYGLFGEDSSSKLAGIFTNSTKDRINILVLGVDERKDDAGRSDTTFLVTIDTASKKVTMLSIPRDSRLKIAGHGWDKFNHAYAFGGTKLSKSTLENLLGIPIDYTVSINLNGFVRLVDAIGGVTIDVEKRMRYVDPYDDNGGLHIDLKPGVQRMDGKTAVEYVRYRDEEGDIGRVARQQKFLKALTQEFTKPKILTKLPELVRVFAEMVKTDMPTREMVKLIPIVKEAASAGLNTEMLNGTPVYIKGVSYWVPDIKDVRAKVAQMQGFKIDYKYNQETERLVAEYRNSVPSEAKVADTPTEDKRSAETKPKEDDKSATKNTATASDSKAENAHSNGQSKTGTKSPNTKSISIISSEAKVNKNNASGNNWN
ncbi:MAG: cell envelope-related transcriptional attenuator [Firmicutes bacterium]|nr:cell envelope-related transcriptional attenuator [Bacillota bacterium]